VHAVAIAGLAQQPQVHRVVHPHVAGALHQRLDDDSREFVGVLGQTLFDRDIAWALCEPDGDFCTPPLLRLALASGKHIHIPIGLHLVQWCLLPLQPGEEAASLADWVADQFTGAEA
jgi:hypothetical protein